jgi:hypothetical protein
MFYSEHTYMQVRTFLCTTVTAVIAFLVGCSSDPPPPPDLTPARAAGAIAEKWAHEELNHFRVVFHSDTLLQCGVEHGLWKLTEIKDQQGNTLTAKYQLTERGKQILTEVDIKESGRGHLVVLKGPYRSEITNIVDGGQPNLKKVAFRWAIDWDKAPADLKACLPQFELTGNEGALFVLNDPAQPWMLASLLRADEVAAPGAAGSVLDKLH